MSISTHYNDTMLSPLNTQSYKTITSRNQTKQLRQTTIPSISPLKAVLKGQKLYETHITHKCLPMHFKIHQRPNHKVLIWQSMSILCGGRERSERPNVCERSEQTRTIPSAARNRAFERSSNARLTKIRCHISYQTVLSILQI